MIIYKETEEVLAEVPVDDTSYRYRAVKGANEVNLNFSLAEPLDIPLGSYIYYEGIKYTLEEPPAITKKDSRNIAYKAVFSAPQATLNRYRFRNTVDGRLKFSLTAKPHEHLQMLVDNLNLRENGWTAGDCIDDVEKVVSYDYSTCAEALDMISEAFDTEWEVKNRQISLKKVEYFVDNPLPLSYGKGNGFVSGVGRQNRSDEDSGLEILYAIGGDRNITPEQNTGGEKTASPFPNIRPIPVKMEMSSFPVAKAAARTAAAQTAEVPNPAMGNTNLILPRNQELEYKGEVYATDEQGYYIYKKNKPFTSRKEGALDCSEIYPKRVGEITEVIVADADKNFYDFKDTSIPANLNYEDCIIDEEKMTVIFQDGMLAGKEFEVKYKHAERRFEILPQDIDNIKMPNAETGFVPVVGGKYAVFNVKMPDAYVCDNATKSGASWEMFRKAAEYLHDHADYLFTFNGTLDGIWAKKNWEEIRERLVPGGMILFSDNQFQPNGVRIRIVGIKDYLNDPHRPELELSNETVGQTVSGRIAQLETQEVAIEDNARSGRQYTKRTFRDAKETMQMLQDSLDKFQGEFTEGISPITINSMQMLVGSEQCQFEFVRDSSNNAAMVVNPSIQYSADPAPAKTGKLICGAEYVRFSISVNMSTAPAWKYAYIPSKTLTGLEADKAYYVYLDVSTEGESNSANKWECYATAQDFVGYNRRRLLVGILDKDMYGHRSWCPMYGYTEITPGRIRVNKIISTDGNTSFDLAQGIITGRINFKDGLISGLIGVAGDTGQINAGMNGEGTSPDTIRFWAGATEANMANAPWQVLMDGTNVMDKAIIRSSSYIQGFLYNRRCVLTRYNWASFMITNDVTNDKYFNIKKYGGNIFFEDDIALQNVNIKLPEASISSSWTDIFVDDIELSSYAIDFIEKILIIRKKSNTTKPFSITGSVTISDPNLFTLFAKCALYKKEGKATIGFLPMMGVNKDGVILDAYSQIS